MRPLYYLSFLCAFYVSESFAQNTINIKGKIIEEEQNEAIIGANIFCKEKSVGVTTNLDGEYNLQLEISAVQDSITLEYSYVGFNNKTIRLLPNRDTIIDVALNTGVEFTTIEVEADGNKERLNSTQMGMLQLTAEEIKQIPVMFGEVDVLKVLQLKPGVQSGGEGTSGLFVRGGTADQNLFLLDETPIYNPSHLFGFFSTFNSDAVKDVTLYKAGFPAQYGGKLSAVVNVTTRDGNSERFSISGGIGLIASRVTIEGPIKLKKGKLSYLFSARRTYVDLITELFNKANKNNKNWTQIPGYNFLDLNGKISYTLSNGDRIYLTGFFGRDFFDYKNDRFGFNFDWGNAVAAIRWVRNISADLVMNNIFSFSDYNYKIATAYESANLALGSGIRDFNLKSEFAYFPNEQHTIKFGANAILHRFKVNDLSYDALDNDLDRQIGNLYYAGDFALYMNDDWSITEKFKLNIGLRLVGFINDKKFYTGAEPRLSARYAINDKMSLKANYAQMKQFVHLVSSSGAAFPTDVWYPSTRKIKPQASDLISIGYEYAISPSYYLSVETYYKWLHQQIDFRDGANLTGSGRLDGEFIFGKGASYGIETYLEKKKGQWHGWIGYTLSRAWRAFPDIMQGRKFSPKYDRRHDFSIVLMYDFKKAPITLSASWVYGTGNAISLPTSRYIHTDYIGKNPYNFVPVYSERNGFRMPAYHRLDLGLVWNLHTKNPKKIKSDLTFSIYNVYSRLNTFMIYIDAIYANEDAQIPQRFVAKSIALFPIIPTVTWNFKF